MGKRVYHPGGNSIHWGSFSYWGMGDDGPGLLFLLKGGGGFYTRPIFLGVSGGI